jgi:hypothetical protein
LNKVLSLSHPSETQRKYIAPTKEQAARAAPAATIHVVRAGSASQSLGQKWYGWNLNHVCRNWMAETSRIELFLPFFLWFSSIWILSSLITPKTVSEIPSERRENEANTAQSDEHMMMMMMVDNEEFTVE